MTDLLAWLLALPLLLDGHAHPIARPREVIDAIATVTLERPEVDAHTLAATLDVLAAHESNYSAHPRGSNDHGHSKGAWQTPSRETPDDLLGQARIAAKWILVSWTMCPSRPLNAYASGPGHCAMRIGVA